MVELKSLTFEQWRSVRENTLQNFDEHVNKIRERNSNKPPSDNPVLLANGVTRCLLQGHIRSEDTEVPRIRKRHITWQYPPFIMGVHETTFTRVSWNRVAFWKYRTPWWSLGTTSLSHCWRSCSVFSLTSSFKRLIYLDVEYTPDCSDRNRHETGVEVTK
jgi:hypothetical protein